MHGACGKQEIEIVGHRSDPGKALLTEIMKSRKVQVLEIGFRRTDGTFAAERKIVADEFMSSLEASN